MEKLLQYYLRIVDIDPKGYFIRLINMSPKQSLDLSNVSIRQYRLKNKTSNPIEQQDLTLTSYKFKDHIRPFLRRGEIVTIYSKGYDPFKFDVAPSIFTAENIRQWLTNDDIQTEISINQKLIHSYKNYSFSTNDVPLLLINRSIKTNSFYPKKKFHSHQYARFIYPYCLSTENLVNPYTSAMNETNDDQFDRIPWYKTKQIVKHFDSYSRRLTTAPLPKRNIKQKLDCNIFIESSK